MSAIFQPVKATSYVLRKTWCTPTYSLLRSLRNSSSSPLSRSCTPDTTKLSDFPKTAAPPTRDMPNPYGPYAAVRPTTPSIDILSSTVHDIRDFKVYESLVYCPNHLLICLFTSRCSTWSEVLKSSFSTFAAGYKEKSSSLPQPETGAIIPHVFLKIDVDECPRAAYHADIDDVPTVVLMMGDDAFRRKIAPVDRCDATTVLDRTVEAVNVFDATSMEEIKLYHSKASWYDHNIRVDNLNVLRVGWPTV